jgi:hypothetical protein
MHTIGNFCQVELGSVAAEPTTIMTAWRLGSRTRILECFTVLGMRKDRFVRIETRHPVKNYYG